MPTSDGQVYGFKYVNGHPKNMRQGLQTVTAFGVLADVHNGYPTFLAEMTVLTALRTAATSAFAAKLLADQSRFMDALSQAIVNKVLHAPMVKLKDSSRAGHGRRWTEMISELFGLRPTE